MKTTKIRANLIIFCWIIFGVTQATESSPTPPNNTITAAEAEILNLTNQERKKKGLSPLIINNHLMEVARQQSASMAHNRHLSHTVKGKGFAYRIRKSGYSYRHVGENVARSRQTAPHVINMWMKSHGHRVNILKHHFKEMGIGITATPNGDKYYTQVFGAQR